MLCYQVQEGRGTWTVLQGCHTDAVLELNTNLYPCSSVSSFNHCLSSYTTWSVCVYVCVCVVKRSVCMCLCRCVYVCVRMDKEAIGCVPQLLSAFLLETGSHWLGSHWLGYDVLRMSLAACSHCRSLWFGPSLCWNKNSGSVSYFVSRRPWKGPGAITHCYETDRNDRAFHASTESVQAPEPTLETSNAVEWGHYLSTGEEKRDRQTDPWGLLASLSYLVSFRPIETSQKTTQTMPKKWPELFFDLHQHAQTCEPTPKHTCTHKKLVSKCI